MLIDLPHLTYCVNILTSYRSFRNVQLLPVSVSLRKTSAAFPDLIIPLYKTDISFPAVEAVSLFFIIPQLCEKSKRFNSWCIYFLGLSSYVVKALNEVRSRNTISKTSISQKSHCLVAYSATWGLLGYSDGASSKLNPFIDIGLVMIFFTDIYRSH